jgi:hypothetical protein
MTGGQEVPVAVALSRGGRPGRDGGDRETADLVAELARETKRSGRAGAVTDAPPKRKSQPDSGEPAVDRPAKPPADKAPAGEQFGTLGLMSKPPCNIFIDGRDTGDKTPQAAIRLKAGRHRITLVNNEFGIKESFHVQVKANDTVKVLKDLTDRLPQ